MKNLIISLIVVLGSISDVGAYDFIEGGIAYNILPNGTLSVTYRWEEIKSAKSRNPNTISFYSVGKDSPFLYRGKVKIPSTVKHNGKEYKVTEIGYRAFDNCRQLTSLILPEGLRRMEFCSIVLTKIKSLNIPSTVKEIVPGAVTQCYLLANLTVAPNNPKYVSQGNCIYTKNMTQLIMVSPTLKTYEFPPTVTSIADFVFESSTITRLEIPNTLEYIGGNAFAHSYIGNIVCNKVLKKLPRSDDYVPEGDSLPPWAIGKGEYEPDEKKGKSFHVCIPLVSISKERDYLS